MSKSLDTAFKDFLTDAIIDHMDLKFVYNLNDNSILIDENL